LVRAEQEGGVIGLAIMAQTDADARQVLRDAVLESGWWDARVVNMLSGPVRRGRKNMRLSVQFAEIAGESWARAVLAVLLFDGMSTTLWPGAESSLLPQPTLADVGYILRTLWPQERMVRAASHRDGALRRQA
jgi:hypothetical protein